MLASGIVAHFIARGVIVAALGESEIGRLKFRNSTSDYFLARSRVTPISNKPDPKRATLWLSTLALLFKFI